MSLLLEVVIGFGLLGTCLLMIFGIFPTSRSTMAVAKDRAIAINLAREIAEKQRVSNFSDPTNSVGVHPLASVFSECIINGDLSKAGSGVTTTEFRRQYIITSLSPTVKHLDARVEWTLGAAGSTTGLVRSVQLESMITTYAYVP